MQSGETVELTWSEIINRTAQCKRTIFGLFGETEVHKTNVTLAVQQDVFLDSRH